MAFSTVLGSIRGMPSRGASLIVASMCSRASKIAELSRWQSLVDVSDRAERWDCCTDR